MSLQELIVAFLIAVLLITFFSTGGYVVKELCVKESGFPTTLGDTGVTISGNGSEPAELTQQTMTPEEATHTSELESDTAQESTTEQTADEPTKIKITWSTEQRTSCNLVSVFLSGVASVLFTELIVEIKNKI